MSEIRKEGFVYIGRRELPNHGHYVWYAVGVETQHQEAWLLHQQRKFRGTKIGVSSSWPNNSTVLAYYEGPPGEHREVFP